MTLSHGSKYHIHLIYFILHVRSRKQQMFHIFALTIPEQSILKKTGIVMVNRLDDNQKHGFYSINSQLISFLFFLTLIHVNSTHEDNWHKIHSAESRCAGLPWICALLQQCEKKMRDKSDSKNKIQTMMNTHWQRFKMPSQVSLRQRNVKLEHLSAVIRNECRWSVRKSKTNWTCLIKIVSYKLIE